MRALLSCLVVFSALTCSGVATAAFTVPDGATYPFESWVRGAANSTYAQWNTFSTPLGPNVPDVGSYVPFVPATPPNVAEAGGHGAFVAGSGNIYSFSSATDFDVTLPSYGLAGYGTRFVAQIKTQGSEIAPLSVRLSMNGGDHDYAPDFVQELSRVSLGGFGGADVETMYVWDLGINPASFLLEFNSASSSMSLDQVAVDAFAHPVPEPATLALAGLGLCAAGLRRRRS